MLKPQRSIFDSDGFHFVPSACCSRHSVALFSPALDCPRPSASISFGGRRPYTRDCRRLSSMGTEGSGGKTGYLSVVTEERENSPSIDLVEVNSADPLRTGSAEPEMLDAGRFPQPKTALVEQPDDSRMTASNVVRRILLTAAMGAVISEVAGHALFRTVFPGSSDFLDAKSEFARAVTISFLAGVGALSAQALAHIGASKSKIPNGRPGGLRHLAQRFHKFQPAWERVFAQAGFAACYTGLFQPHVFHILNSISWAKFLSGQPGTPIGEIVEIISPLLLNQLVFIPTLYWPSYFFFNGIVWETPMKLVASNLTTALPKVMKVNLGFWIPAQGLQFAVVPAEHHSMYVALMGVLWNIILAVVTASQSAGKKD